MDKSLKYRRILVGFLEECAATPYAKQPDLKKQVVIDTKRHHYQLLSVGWFKETFACDIIFHFDIVEDKVWIQQNNTELQIADELIERGIKASDIVIGFYPPEARELVKHAIA